MKRKTLVPTLVTLALLLGVTGVAVLAASDGFQSILPRPSANSTTSYGSVYETSQNGQLETAATDASSSATPLSSELPAGPDASSSATPQSSGQPAGPDATSSATPRSSGQPAGPDATSSATPQSSGNDEDDEDDRDEDDRSDDYANQFIGADQAKSIALAHAGNGAVIKSVELEDDYPPVYKIDVRIGDEEFELKIHAVTGALLEESREDDD